MTTRRSSKKQIDDAAQAVIATLVVNAPAPAPAPAPQPVSIEKLAKQIANPEHREAYVAALAMFPSQVGTRLGRNDALHQARKEFWAAWRTTGEELKTISPTVIAKDGSQVKNSVYVEKSRYKARCARKAHALAALLGIS